MSLLFGPLCTHGNGNGAGFATWNPLDSGVDNAFSNGDLTVTHGAGLGWRVTRSTVGVSSGKWYWEVTKTAGGGATDCIVGVATASANLNSYCGSDAYAYGYLDYNGNRYHSGSGTAYGSTFATGDVIGVALNLVDMELEFFLMAGGVGPGVSQGVIDISDLSGPIFAAVSGYAAGDAATANFGASPFVGTVPTGFNEGLEG